MCGEAEPWNAVEVLRRTFNAGEVRVKELLRGDGLVQAAG
jgi:S-adenosylmethionine decarboxylase